MRILKIACGLALAASAACPAQAQSPGPPADLLYTPITPCRAFDTTKNSKLPSGASRNFQIAGTSSFVSQGGPSNGCGIPDSAGAVSINLTAVNGSAAGLASFSTFGYVTSAASLRFATNAPSTILAVVALGQRYITGRTNHTVNLQGEITGYYAPSLSGIVKSDGTTIRKTARVLSTVRNQLGSYTVTFDRDVSSCMALATPYSTTNAYIFGSTRGDKADFNTAPASNTNNADDRQFSFLVTC